MLDIYFHDARNLPILEANFVLVHVNIGHMDENVDIAEQYEIPLDKGVPALAVLSDKGKLLYSQKGGEFESMRHMESSAVTQFLVQWKPRQRRLLGGDGELLSAIGEQFTAAQRRQMLGVLVGVDDAVERR